MPSRFTMTHPDNSEQLVRLNHDSISAKINSSPLFLVHSILGDPVQDFATLTSVLEDFIPLWGLRSKGHSDPTRLFSDSIELMASSYIKEIQRIQPVGPYRLAGLSAGGTIAWEMASQLESRNQFVRLILLDSVSPDIWRNLEGCRHTEAVYYLGYYLLSPELRLIDTILKDMRLVIEGITNNQAQIKQLFKYLHSVAPSPVCYKNIKIAERILEAIYDYQPRPIQSNIHIFKTLEAFIPCDEKMGWCADDYQSILIQGNHETFLTDPDFIISLKKILEAATTAPPPTLNY
jgi:pimeloyl-ACP methyl ester carboxylesterase